jgi:hypothetical protein
MGDVRPEVLPNVPGVQDPLQAATPMPWALPKVPGAQRVQLAAPPKEKEPAGQGREVGSVDPEGHM